MSMVEMSAGTCAWGCGPRGGVSIVEMSAGTYVLGAVGQEGGVSIVEMSVEVAWPASSDTLT